MMVARMTQRFMGQEMTDEGIGAGRVDRIGKCTKRNKLNTLITYSH